jgi:hypothetical protein
MASDRSTAANGPVKCPGHGSGTWRGVLPPQGAMDRLRACWVVTQAESGFAAAPQMNLPGSKFDPYQHVQRFGLHGRMSLASMPAPGGGALSIWGRPRSRVGGAWSRSWSRRPYPELEQLAPNSHVASPVVLSPKWQDQLFGPRGRCGPSRRAVRPDPPSCDELPVPTQERLWANQERTQAPPPRTVLLAAASNALLDAR